MKHTESYDKYRTEFDSVVTLGPSGDFPRERSGSSDVRKFSSHRASMLSDRSGGKTLMRCSQACIMWLPDAVSLPMGRSLKAYPFTFNIDWHQYFKSVRTICLLACSTIIAVFAFGTHPPT